MSYPIANVIYGIPLSEKICDTVIPENPGFDLETEVGTTVWDVDDLLWGLPEKGGFGFTSLYSASPDGDKTAGYLGVELWADAYWKLKPEHLQLVPSFAQILEVAQMVSKLPEWVRSELPPEMRVSLVWSDS